MEDPLFETVDIRGNKLVGTWCFMQLIMPNRTITDEGGHDRHASYNTTDFILDIAFPYGSAIVQDTYRLAGPDMSGQVYNYTIGDSPFIAMASSTKVNGVYPLYNKRTMTEEFYVYLMYMPPPSNMSNLTSQWVPLKKLDWKTSGTATRNDILSNVLPFLTGGSVIPVSITDTAVHPTWAKKLTKPEVDAPYIPIPPNP